MIPGEGYKIIMKNPDVLVYPANSVNYSKAEVLVPTTYYYRMANPSGSDMTIGIPIESWTTKPAIGDEIAVFDSDNNLVGSTVFTGSNIAMTIWGTDSQESFKTGLKEKEALSFELYRKADGNTEPLIIQKWAEGNGLYHENGIAIVGKIIPANDLVEISLINYPNPFSNYTNVEFVLPEAGNVKLSLYDAQGKSFRNISNDYFLQGKQTIRFDSKGIASGNYFIKLVFKNNTISIPVQIVE